MNNFEFLKTIDKNLYNIISDAEKLFRDEYFEQCITQTRRFGENICKNVLGNTRTSENTFDEMLATLKDRVTDTIQEKEFVDDLYFLKKEGNVATHSELVKNSGQIALECLQRSFEIGVNYALYKGNYNKKSELLKLRYDTELLVTGRKSKQTLAEKYAEEKARNSRTKIQKPKAKSVKKAKPEKQYHKMRTQAQKNNSFFKAFVKLTAILSALLSLIIACLALS